MKPILTAVAAVVAASFASTSAYAATCKTDKSPDDMTYEDAGQLYDCLKDEMQAGYRKGPKRWVPAAYAFEYRSWTRASDLPANPGVHGERYLMTWVNREGASEYLKFKDDGTAKMPAGTVIAKESFTVGKDGTAKPGPIFFMEKVGAGKSKKTNDWYYTMVSPSGAPQAVNVYKACNECHSNYEDSDWLGYPEEDVRAKN